MADGWMEVTQKWVSSLTCGISGTASDAWGRIVTGAVALLVGYLGLSGTLETGKQIPYVVSGDLVGLFLLGVGALVWVSADLRDEWRKLDVIELALAGSRGSVAAPATRRVSENPPPSKRSARSRSDSGSPPG